MGTRRESPLLSDSISARFILLSLLSGALAILIMSGPAIWRIGSLWLHDRIQTAHLASLALSTGMPYAADPELHERLLNHTGILSIKVFPSSGAAPLLLGPDIAADTTYDQDFGLLSTMHFTFSILFSRHDGAVRVRGISAQSDMPVIEVTLSRKMLRDDLMTEIRSVFIVGVFTTALIAILLYVAVQTSLVSRLRNLTTTRGRCRAAPEDQRRVISPSGALDEIGAAEQALRQMQIDLRDALVTRAHLAAIGTAVSKIQHDLRGTLSSLIVASDRLEDSPDPEVRNLAPTMIAALDRAVEMCRTSLTYARQGSFSLTIERVNLSHLVQELFQAERLAYAGRLTNAVEPGVEAFADPGLLHRALANLVRNALEASAPSVTIAAAMSQEGTEIIVSDTGTGIPPLLLSKLFVPFLTSGGAGKVGLGLSIAREIMQAHGGSIELRESGQDGTRFRLWIPGPPTS